MQSRRDQLQAYKFLTRRALAALVVGEPDVPEPPMRRLSLTTITGIMIAVLVIAGFAVVGFLRPGTNTKLSTGTIYVEKETGTDYVVLGDNNLHATLNYPSAVLAASGSDSGGKVPVKTVPASTLAHKTHGATIGIDGVPQSLPRSTSHLVSTPWTICSQIKQQAVDRNLARVAVSAGSDAGATPLPADSAVLVGKPRSEDRFLLLNGKRLQVAPEVARALQLQTSQALTVGSSLLNALPQGPSLVVPTVPGAGQGGLDVGGAHAVIGQLITITDAPSNTKSNLVVLRGGVATVNPLEAALLATVPLSGGRELSAVTTRFAATQGLPAAPPAEVDDFVKQFDGLPPDLPQLPNGPAQAGGVCVVYNANPNPQLSLAYPPGSAPSNLGGVDETPQSRHGIADEVDVPAEKAALVVGDNGAAARYIVAAPGKRYSISTDALSGFGYGGVTPLKLPQQWVLLMPPGPALDRNAPGMNGAS